MTPEQATRYRRASLLLDEEGPFPYTPRERAPVQDRVADTRAGAARGAERSEVPDTARARSEPARTRVPSNVMPTVGGEQGVASLAFPTGERASSALMLHQYMPREVVKGQGFDYEYHVENLLGVELKNVVLSVDAADNLRILSADPPAIGEAYEVHWSLGTLAPRETKVIRVHAESAAVGNASNCVSVSYDNSLCAGVPVVDPALMLVKKATERELLCNVYAINYQVCNTGTGAATNVVIRDTLPQGLTVANSGARTVEIPVGTLNVGDCRDFDVTVKAERVGAYASSASATADYGLTAQAEEVRTVVVQPMLVLECESQDRQYLGRNVTYRYRLTNESDIASENTVVEVALPGGAEFVRASQGGVASQGRVTFNVGSLAAGASRTFDVVFMSGAAGDFNVTAKATADCTVAVATECTTMIRGIPAVLLEVVDLIDPVPVGSETTYVITVTNQGSAEDTDVRIVCTLPESLEYVSSTGTTPATARGKTVTFAPVARLDAKQHAEWRVVVRAVSEADSRFAVEMNTEQLTSPVRETEATYTYE